MKKTIKILTAAILAIGFGSLANAQSATITANATVINELIITNLQDLNFGTIVVGQIKTITANNIVAVSTGPKLGSTTQGIFNVEAQVGSNVTLTFVLPTNLSTSGGALLPVFFDWDDDSLIAFEDGEFYSSAVPLGSPYEITNFNNSSGSVSSKVYVGGQVNATAAIAGTYTGAITLSATYN